MSEATLLRRHRPILRFERHLPQPVEIVWHAVTDLDEMRSWFPTRIEIDEWTVGASLVHHFDEHGIAPRSGTVLEWDPPHRVSFTWSMTRSPLSCRPTRAEGPRLSLPRSERQPRRSQCGWSDPARTAGNSAQRASHGNPVFIATSPPSNPSWVIKKARPKACPTNDFPHAGRTLTWPDPEPQVRVRRSRYRFCALRTAQGCDGRRKRRTGRVGARAYASARPR